MKNILFNVPPYTGEEEKYIADVIRNIADEDICMQFNTNVSPCVITKNGGDDYFYLILPVRVFS